MSSFEHLKLIRRFLAEKRSGTISLQTDRGIIELNIFAGSFLSERGGSAAEQTVQAMLMNQVSEHSIKSLQLGVQNVIYSTPEDVVLKACYEGNLSENCIAELFKYFRLFPLVIVKMAPLHKADAFFPAYFEYLQLHKESALNGRVSLRDYLARANTPKAIRSSVQLLTALYVLGLIAPAGPSRPGKVQGKKGGMIGRIMTRIRGL